MAKKSSKETIKGLQNDEDYILLNNPLSSPKFIRTIGKGQNKKELSINETYTPKVFYEIVSRLKPEHLEGIKRTETVKFDINIKQFLAEIGANIKNYRHLIDSVDALQSTLLKWKEGHETITVPIITKSIHNDKTGKIELYVDSDLAKRVLEVKEKENFSFLKSNVFRLQNAQAIKLYPFFKSWANYNKGYEVELERFKTDFGYNTSGYARFGNLERYVLKPAIEEINEKTDIIIIYELVGDNLESQRPRVRGLIFYIQNKEKVVKKIGEKLQNQERNEATPQDEPTHISNLIPKAAPQEPKKKAQPQAIPNAPSEAEIQNLGAKLKLNPEQIQTIKDRLKHDYIRTFEVLQGCVNEVKNGNPIKSNFAYILGTLDSLGVGLWQQEQEKAKKREADRIENEKKLLVNKLQKEYNERRNKQFTELYNKATPEQIAPYYDRFRAETNKWGMNFFLDVETGKLKETGIYTIGEELAEQKNLGKEYRQNKFRVETFEKYHLQIDFTPKEEIIISLFEQEPPSDPQPQSIEATPPTAPSMATTTPLPHVSEVVEPTPSDFFAQNANPNFEEQPPQNIEETERVETPKSIKSLLNRFFK